MNGPPSLKRGRVHCVTSSLVTRTADSAIGKMQISKCGHKYRPMCKMRTYISMIYRAFKQCGLWLRLRVAASHGDPHITRIPLIFKLSKRLVAVTPFRLLAALECKCYSLCGIQITVTSFTIRTTIIIKYKNANFVDFIMALTFV